MQRQFQGFGSLLAAGGRCAGRFDTVNKVQNFCGNGQLFFYLGIIDRQIVHIINDGFVLAVCFHAGVHKVHGYISVRLEKMHKTGAFKTGAAGSYVGYGSVGKMQADVGDILVRRKHAESYGIHVNNLAGNNSIEQINIVNHQVQYYADVGHTSVVRPLAGNGNKARVFDIFYGFHHRRVKAFYVPHLQDEVVAFGGLN